MTGTKINTSKDGEWAITAKRFVGYLDIMGFKDMVAKSTHDEIYDMMKRIEKQKTFNEDIKWGKTDSKLVKTTTYSDSIMVYSKDNSRDSLHSILCTMSAVSDDLFLEGIPHKGALAFGMMTLDTEKNIFFGQPLIDAYLLQDELFYYGIIVHASAEQAIEEAQEGKKAAFTETYLCPLKNGFATHLTIAPMSAPPLTVKEAENPRLVEQAKNLRVAIQKLRYKTSGYLRRYIDNTEAYLKIFASIPK